jgi:hypothetical protein
MGVVEEGEPHWDEIKKIGNDIRHCEGSEYSHAACDQDDQDDEDDEDPRLMKRRKRNPIRTDMALTPP